MKILVVGGTGFVGGYTSLYLQDKGYDVTIMARSKPKGTSRLNDLPYVKGNYIDDDFNDGRLEGYDGLMFCAGSDLGVYPADGSISKADFFHKANVLAIPAFFAAAKRAGIARSVYMSSFYPLVSPNSKDPYVYSRQLADEGARALSCESFNVCSLGLPWILGYVEGLPVAHWTAFAKAAKGELPGLLDFAPPGGANYMTCQSVAEAMEGGLLRGESGKSYIIGDVNLSWKAFFELWCKAAGRPRDIPVREDLEHPVLLREIINYVGGRMAHYETPAEETRLLGYQQGLALGEIEASYRYYVDQPLPQSGTVQGGAA